MRQRPEPASQPWIEWFAGRISDPVVRLRFLKAVAPSPALRPKSRRVFRSLFLPLLLLAVIACGFLMWAAARGEAPPARLDLSVPAPAASDRRPPDVWLVENSGGLETYSNGLRIDNHFAVSTHSRSYLAFPAKSLESPAERRTTPVGIVFHSTESRQVPFEAMQNRALKRIGESLLEYVRRKRAYHFLIDRFGRVYRIVNEGDVANHAGYSAWADGDWLYLNLNESFLGISFEGRTGTVQTAASIGPGQVRAAAMLAEMLRGRYGIAARNCVTHAQVSVSPSNMRVGYHTDWASGFPFEQMGLPDNYARPLPALWAFGFEADSAFLRAAGGAMRPGLDQAGRILLASAAASHLPLDAYRKALQKAYRERLAQVRSPGSNEPE